VAVGLTDHADVLVQGLTYTSARFNLISYEERRASKPCSSRMDEENRKMKIKTIIAAATLAMSSSCAFAGGVESGPPRSGGGTVGAGPGAVSPPVVVHPNANAGPGDFAKSYGLGARGRAGESVTGLPVPGTSNSPGPNAARE
jgi:hypothetical protein